MFFQKFNPALPPLGVLTPVTCQNYVNAYVRIPPANATAITKQQIEAKAFGNREAGHVSQIGLINAAHAPAFQFSCILTRRVISTSVH